MNCKLFITALLGILSVVTAGAQVRPACDALFLKADTLISRKQYQAAARLCFQAFDESPVCRSNANLLKTAKICMRAGLPDSMFSCLTLIVTRKAHSDYVYILSDPDYLKFKHDARWIRLKSALDSYLGANAKELDSLHQERLKMDTRLMLLAKKFGSRSKRYLAYRDTTHERDSVNSIKLLSMIRSWGWMSADQIDERGVDSMIYLFWKLSFSDQKRYFPMISAAFRKGTFDAKRFADIADRIALKDKGRQIYGTQLGTDNLPLPVENADSLNFRRREIGLPPVHK
ncbi:DUF6624 domain-containing protein [Mucilaginibacter celer]|uniref:Tetratricopeptide repeat protein n=1 Tax=Mucilaginibacter celer TaxID=2305508 RepID=A0A494VK53_9SPHI|nr:DUF6624 domain-containing protein [Mucilaginibacter celer]AYL94299.1 hypothetical protein HYN43_002870 [Mucilaginibacter celer]